MSPDQLFVVANVVVLPAWLLLLVAPRSRATEVFVHTAIVPILLSVAYLTLFAMKVGEAEGDFTTLAGVMLLFTNPWGVLIGWIHYLAFDLFIGAWEARDAARHGLSHARLVPCLLLTFVLGPIGLLLYLGLRRLHTGRSSLGHAR